MLKREARFENWFVAFVSYEPTPTPQFRTLYRVEGIYIEARPERKRKDQPPSQKGGKLNITFSTSEDSPDFATSF